MGDDFAVKSPHRKWAEFRFSVIGRLLASPAKRGLLRREIGELSDKDWRHPLTGKACKFSFSTIEAWYYRARNEKRDPVGQLRSKVRRDLGVSRRLTDAVKKVLHDQYGNYPSWTYQLHADNLAAAIIKDPLLGDMPSYQSVRRHMKNQGLTRRRKPVNPTDARAINRLELRETRSFEAEFVHSLWHLDYHHSPLKVLGDSGVWETPIVMGIFDDYSRLCCHVQWYLNETAENLVHAFSQALLKRGVPRELAMDNGSAMISEEFTEGLLRLGVTPRHTLPRSPHQNGKCEFAWQKVDGRLMAMLEGYKDLTISYLNDVTQAWAEMEYNRLVHDETKERPIDRFVNGKDVGRVSPSFTELKLLFQREVCRRHRKSDGTISLMGRRFEVPSRFRHLDRVTIKYAFWDLSFVHLIDFRTGEAIARLYPIDRTKNGEGIRRSMEDPVLVAAPMTTTELPPLLSKLVADYEALGLKPAYLPKTDDKEEKHYDGN
jgi:putative transposase